MNKANNKPQKQTYVQVRDGRLEQGKTFADPIVAVHIELAGKDAQVSGVAAIAGTSGCKQSNRFEALQDITDKTHQYFRVAMAEQDLKLEMEINANLLQQDKTTK